MYIMLNMRTRSPVEPVRGIGIQRIAGAAPLLLLAGLSVHSGFRAQSTEPRGVQNYVFHEAITQLPAFELVVAASFEAPASLLVLGWHVSPACVVAVGDGNWSSSL